MSQPPKTLCWDLRVTSDEDLVVREAAAESNQTLSEFVRSAAVKEARRLVRRRRLDEPARLSQEFKGGYR